MEGFTRFWLQDIGMPSPLERLVFAVPVCCGRLGLSVKPGVGPDGFGVPLYKFLRSLDHLPPAFVNRNHCGSGEDRG